MAELSLKLNVGDGGLEQLQAVIDRMREEETELPQKFLQTIRDMAAVLRDEAKAKVLGEPTHSAFHSGLRAKLAEGTSVEDNSDGASVVVNPEGEDDRLPADMDEGGWSHPVFGNTNRWVHQGGYYSWFMDTMDEADDRLDQQLGDTLDRAIAYIAAQ